MNKPFHEWVEKAEEDYRATLSLNRLKKYPVHGVVCFHAQQCIEKYLKAILEKNALTVRKIHALTILLEECSALHPFLSSMREDMIRLSTYAVEFRYPGESAVAKDSQEAVAIMKRSRLTLRNVLGLNIKMKTLGEEVDHFPAQKDKPSEKSPRF